jgi:hypothetical protein
LRDICNSAFRLFLASSLKTEAMSYCDASSICPDQLRVSSIRMQIIWFADEMQQEAYQA